MTEQEYTAIAAACDRILRASDTSLGRLAIPLLHVIDEHPGHLAQYAPLLSSRRARLASPAGSPARIAARVARSLARSLRPRRSRSARLQSPEHVDVLIASRPVAPALRHGEDDFYFGAMPRLLRDRGATCTVIHANPLAISPLDEVRIWLQCVAARGQLRRTARSLPKTLDGAAALLASRHALSGVTAANLRLHAGISDVCRLLNPRIVITTHEGAAAERMIWHAARSDGRRPLCVGYQHTRLLEHAHAIRRPVRAPAIDCDPDVVLTLGEIPHAILAASPDLGSAKLIAYGSHRRAEPTMSVPFGERPRQCLVLPDADERECTLLFEFATECARRLPQLKFKLRPHPVVNLPALRQRHGWLRDLPANAEFSTGKALEQECAGARYCLYRGSSAAIHAALAGVKPIYLARAGELPFDPLFGLADWHETITSPEDFTVRVLAADESPDTDAARRAWNFCDRYVSKLRPEALDELLAMLPSRETSRRSGWPSELSSSSMSSAK